jgi:hypothetical protein
MFNDTEALFTSVGRFYRSLEHVFTARQRVSNNSSIKALTIFSHAYTFTVLLTVEKHLSREISFHMFTKP